MEIAKADKSALIIAFADAIQNGSFDIFSRILLPDNWEKSALAGLEDATVAKLNKQLSDGGLAAFVISELRMTMYSTSTEFPEDDQPLTSVDCFKDTLAVSKIIVANLNKLPRQYRLVSRAFGELADRVKRNDVNIKLSHQLSLISGAIIPKTFSLANENDRYDRYIRKGEFEKGKPFSVDESALYFEFRSSGCIINRTSTRISLDFFDEIRAVYGACLAFNVLGQWTYFDENIQPIVAACEIRNDSESLCYLSRSEEDISRGANLGTTSSFDDAVKNKHKTLEESLACVVEMFSSKDSARLTTAAVWIYRAALSTRPMDSILESTIAMEALLGDRETSDRIGLSKLMANRCAYALGRTLDDRRSIIDFFVSFYKIRSEIVHSGKFKLTDDDNKVVKKGLDLAMRMLRHEITISRN